MITTMKTLLYLFIFLNTLLVLAQRKDVALKINLEDANNGKNIKDAKVTLEGFEIPEIVGTYDKKGKFYYFTEIPNGYNTVMAYHKDYNEKGFQDGNSLPNKLSLKLFDPLNVSYQFDQNSYKSATRKVYVEDPFKFGITSSKNVDYNEFREYIFEEIEKLDLEVEFVNPFLELEKYKHIYPKFRWPVVHNNQKEAYPFIASFPLVNAEEFILPLSDGSSTYNKYLNSNGVPVYNHRNDKIIFYIRKKNGERFKRYNDPYLKKIRTIKDIHTFTILYNKYEFESKNGSSFKKRYSRYIDRNNRFKDIDSSKIFYYFKIDKGRNRNMELSTSINLQFNDLNLYDSLAKQYLSSSKLEKIHTNEKMMFFDSGIGLGFLDQLERIGDSLRLDED